MTLKTSLFNKGIYKSTVRRYLWGSVLYFLLLFMFTVLPTLLSIEPGNRDYFIGAWGRSSLIYEDWNYIFYPIILAMGVSTVVGLLVYRFVHSKKTSVFVHSLPVNRTSVYTSTLAGAFTLMSSPVILNGLIVLVMSLTSYSKIISVSSCFIWIGINLMCLFMMFACTTFVAMLTGNTFATVGLNILFHAVVPVIVACFGFVAKQFLFGYVTDNAIINSVVNGNFVVWIFTVASELYAFNYLNISIVRLIVNLVISVGLYVLAWVLYKKRNLETAEDVAGFKILNPIFKYLLTFLGATVSFALFSEFVGEKLAMFIVIVVLISAIMYFASEMILKKSMKVWKKSYKGFICFAVIFTLLIFVFAFTSFFGYETHVPKADEVESVAVYSYYYNHIPQLSEPDVIDYAIKLHNEFVNNRALLKSDDLYVKLNIEYKLKSGKEVSRAYQVSENRLSEILKDLYEYESYKAVFEEPLALDVNDIHYIAYHTDSEIRIDGDMMRELHKCVVEDIKDMSYDEIYSPKVSSNTINYIYTDEGYDGKKELFTKSYYLSTAFKKTNEWLENNTDNLNEYYIGVNNIYQGTDFYIVKNEFVHKKAELFKNEELNFKGLFWNDSDFTSEGEICYEITADTIEKEYIIHAGKDISENVYNYVINSDNLVSDSGVLYIYGRTYDGMFQLVDAIEEDELKEFVKSVCK